MNATNIYDLNAAYNEARRNNPPGGHRLKALGEIDQLHAGICAGREPDCMKCFIDAALHQFNCKDRPEFPLLAARCM
jgi:hypothetical protein